MNDLTFQVVNFVCPGEGCNCTELEEVMMGITQSTPILSLAPLGEGEVDVEYGNAIADAGEIQHYGCSKCGLIVRDEVNRPLRDPAELLAWLQKRNMLRATNA